MNIDGEYFTLTDLAVGKIKENYVNKKFINNATEPFDYFETSNKLLNNQKQENFYIENKNKQSFDQYIYNCGYIYSDLPYPYEFVYRDGEYNVEIVLHDIYDHSSPPKISAKNLYMEKKQAKTPKIKRSSPVQIKPQKQEKPAR